MTTERMPPPRPGTRPRNRRDLVVGAAAELFTERGYARVSMGDVARAVNVQPSALYRYFASKQDLLIEVVARGTRLRLAAIREGAAEGLDVVLANLADSALASRSSTRLWSVEARNADPAVQAELREEVRALPDELGLVIGRVRRDLSAAHAHLLAWATLDVVASISFHDERLPGRDLRAELVGMMERVAAVDLGGAALDDPDPRATPGVHPARRERVIAAAASMFAARGFAAVRLEDIAAAAGMSAAGLYTYVESKAHLLEVVVVRAANALAHAHAVAAGAPAGRGIDAHLDAYLAMAWSAPELLTVLLVDVRELEGGVAAAVRQVTEDVETAFTATLREALPQLDAPTARIRARAAQMVALDVLATPRLRRTAGARSLVRAAMAAVLGLGEDSARR
ncbi:TetR family transcriptional regulator [Nocardioides zeae]|uniref:Helix-turn-helix transcriptional regulator n=1 Tax=Nocardioides zeae TaxID=1457234 RepID=A0A6P0HKN5_9ACTN|nr:helix-turn-helix transcriptional regulator [Nocardioides zeae]